jgi:hypothetical protein
VRLTLRTLLAYLDDTLDPAEIKTIGQKVAESEPAQELVSRIKQVTRRRRLTVPPDGGPGERFDANRVAIYLDNELPPEDVAELEKHAMESDVHLAEIAATHQILTLVLGEPALVPPTAKRRMYALSQGRPAKPVHKPASSVTKSPGEVDGVPGGDADDTLMALPLFRKLPWLRWALPLTAVVLLVVLGVVMFRNLNSGEMRGEQRTGRDKTDSADGGSRDKTGGDGIKPSDKPADSSVNPEDKPPDRDRKSGDGDKKTDNKDGKTEPRDKKPNDRDKKDGDEVRKIPTDPGPPSKERQPAGTLAQRDQEQMLLHREGNAWKRFALTDTISTGEPLISLPGFKSEVQLESKVNVLLWGNQPEFLDAAMLECAVTLHQPPTSGPDVDLTLHRGRLFLTNRKDRGPATVRVRFLRDEIWDITLEAHDTTVGIELVSIGLDAVSVMRPGLKAQQGEEPFVQVALYSLRGPMSLKVGYRTFGDMRGPPGRALVIWNNKGRGVDGPHTLEANIPQWELEPPPPRQAEAARALNVAQKELAVELARPMKRVEVALREFMQDKGSPGRRVLGVRCLAAIDAIEDLLDALASEDGIRPDVRQEALTMLKNWLNRGGEQGAKLFDRKTGRGLLVDRDYTKNEAQTIVDLLYGFSREERTQKETYEVLIQYLKSKKLLIRSLAIWHLSFLVPARIDYDPAGTVEQRERGYDEYRKLLDTGKLPPMAPPPKPDGGMK